MENYPPQNQNNQEDDPIKRDDAKYQIVEVTRDSDDAFPTYTVVKNERDSNGNKTGNVSYQPGWVIDGEGTDPDSGAKIYKLSPLNNKGEAKYLTPDQLRSIQEKAARLGHIQSGIAEAAAKFAQRPEATPLEPFYDESANARLAEEVRPAIEEAHRRRQAPVIPNLEQMMNGQPDIIDKIPTAEELRKMMTKGDK